MLLGHQRAPPLQNRRTHCLLWCWLHLSLWQYSNKSRPDRKKFRINEPDNGGRLTSEQSDSSFWSVTEVWLSCPASDKPEPQRTFSGAKWPPNEYDVRPGTPKYQLPVATAISTAVVKSFRVSCSAIAGSVLVLIYSCSAVHCSIWPCVTRTTSKSSSAACTRSYSRDPSANLSSTSDCSLVNIQCSSIKVGNSYKQHSVTPRTSKRY